MIGRLLSQIHMHKYTKKWGAISSEMFWLLFSKSSILSKYCFGQWQNAQWAVKMNTNKDKLKDLTEDSITIKDCA